MWKDGMSPEEAVLQMEDPRSFWDAWSRWVPDWVSENTIEGNHRWLRETKVAASSEYMKKEAVREALQGLVTNMVATGQLTNQAGLDEAFAALDMSVKALKMVPFEVWQRMTGSRGNVEPKSRVKKRG
jgi:hypothetical protein